MINSISKIFKATIIKLVVAFFIIILIIIIYKIMFEKKFETVANLINMFAPVETKSLKAELVNGELANKPLYGSKYATMKISSINLELPVYFGESLTILKLGIGQDSNSYFPGEGGTIIYMGHNFKTFLSELPNVKKGDSIEIEADYGSFKYNVYDTKVVGEYDTNEAPIQKNEEILILYTCWPINNVGHADKRYLVYAK